VSLAYRRARSGGTSEWAAIQLLHHLRLSLADRLHVIEKFQKTGPDTLKWTVTIEDPVFFTHPVTYERTPRRVGKDVKMMPAHCSDGAGSLENAPHGHQGPEHKNPPKMPKWLYLSSAAEPLNTVRPSASVSFPP
jgi:hypothetical protein